MKLFNKYFLLMVVSCCLFTACSDDDDDYTVGETVDGQGYYFSNELSSTIDLSESETSFDVMVGRSVTGTAATATITATDESGLFTIPTSVSFGANETFATLTIGYDPDEVGYDSYEITLSLEATGETTPYGLANYTFTAAIPEPWVSIGYATINDYFFFDEYYSVELQQNANSTNYFRLVDPYAEPHGEQGTYLAFNILETGSSLYDIPVTMEDLVYFSDYNTGYYYEYYGADVIIYHPADFGYDESYWTHNAVLSYQDNGLPAIVQLAPIYYMSGVGGWNYSQYDGMITITFPGAEIKDYSAEVTYMGRYTDASDANYVIASVTLSDDVSYAKVAVVEGSDTDAAVEGIIDGSIESTEITANGNVTIPCETSGMHIVVVVTYDADGNAQESASARFNFTAGSEDDSWTSLGTGTYTEDFMSAFYGSSIVITYEVEIQESTETSGLFRLVNPYGEAYPHNEEGDWDDSMDYYLEIDASDPDGVFITKQVTGMDWGYGDVTLWSVADYYMSYDYTLDEVKEAGLCGTYADGVITFPEETLLICMPEYSSSFYTANENGAFKVVLPDATATDSAQTKVAAKTKQNVSKTIKNSASPFKMNWRLRAPVKETLVK